MASAAQTPRKGEVDAKALANLLLDWADEDGIPVSPMKLQKLLFFLHAHCVTRLGVNLIKQEFEAWERGPVIPSIYSEFKNEAKRPIKARARQFDPVAAKSVTAKCVLPGELLNTVRLVFDFYKMFTATELSTISHVEDGPWYEAVRLFAAGRNMDRRISSELIIQFFSEYDS